MNTILMYRNLLIMMSKKHFFTICACLICHIASAQWAQTNGPNGDVFLNMLKNEGLIWGTGLGGLYYSDNEGESWHRHPDFSYEDYSLGICRYKGKLYASVEKGNTNNPTPEQNLFSSANNGQTWQFVASLPPAHQHQIYVHNGGLVLSSGGSTYYSLDDGLSWQGLLGPGGFGGYEHRTPVDSINFVVRPFNQDGIYNSTDFGQTWSVVADPSLGFNYLMAAKGNKVIAQKPTPNPPYAASYLTENLGQSWKLLPNAFPTSSINTYYTFWGGDTIVANNWEDGTYPYKISVDDGNNWQTWGEWGADGFLPQVLTSDGGLSGTSKYYTASGITAARNMGARNVSVQEMASNGASLFVHAGVDFYRSDDKGDHWGKLPFETLYPNSANTGKMAIAGDTIYLGVYNGIFYATNNGESGWQEFSTDDLGLNFELKAQGDFLLAILPDPNFDINVVRVLDRFTGVELYSFGTPHRGDVYLSHGRYISSAIYNSGPNVSISEDNGQTWTETLSPVGQLSCRLFSFDSHLMLLTGKTTMLSTDNGSTWTDIGCTGLPPSPFNLGNFAYIAHAVAVGTTVYAAVDGFGVYKSEDWGATWQVFNDGLGLMRNTCLTEQDGQLFLGTPTSSVWRNPPTNSAVISPKTTENLSITPNPSSGQFSIQLPGASPANLRCYNMLGELVWQKNGSGGRVEVNLNGYPDGIYQCVVLSLGKVYSGSIVLQR